MSYFERLLRVEGLDRASFSPFLPSLDNPNVHGHFSKTSIRPMHSLQYSLLVNVRNALNSGNWNLVESLIPSLLLEFRAYPQNILECCIEILTKYVRSKDYLQSVSQEKAMSRGDGARRMSPIFARQQLFRLFRFCRDVEKYVVLGSFGSTTKRLFASRNELDDVYLSHGALNFLGVSPLGTLSIAHLHRLFYSSESLSRRKRSRSYEEVTDTTNHRDSETLSPEHAHLWKLPTLIGDGVASFNSTVEKRLALRRHREVTHLWLMHLLQLSNPQDTLSACADIQSDDLYAGDLVVALARAISTFRLILIPHVGVMIQNKRNSQVIMKKHMDKDSFSWNQLLHTLPSFLSSVSSGVLSFRSIGSDSVSHDRVVSPKKNEVLKASDTKVKKPRLRKETKAVSFDTSSSDNDSSINGDSSSSSSSSSISEEATLSVVSQSMSQHTGTTIDVHRTISDSSSSHSSSSHSSSSVGSSRTSSISSKSEGIAESNPENVSVISSLDERLGVGFSSPTLPLSNALKNPFLKDLFEECVSDVERPPRGVDSHEDNMSVSTLSSVIDQLKLRIFLVPLQDMRKLSVLTEDNVSSPPLSPHLSSHDSANPIVSKKSKKKKNKSSLDSSSNAPLLERGTPFSPSISYLALSGAESASLSVTLRLLEDALEYSLSRLQSSVNLLSRSRVVVDLEISVKTALLSSNQYRKQYIRLARGPGGGPLGGVFWSNENAIDFQSVFAPMETSVNLVNGDSNLSSDNDNRQFMSEEDVSIEADALALRFNPSAFKYIEKTAMEAASVAAKEIFSLHSSSSFVLGIILSRYLSAELSLPRDSPMFYSLFYSFEALCVLSLGEKKSQKSTLGFSLDSILFGEDGHDQDSDPLEYVEKKVWMDKRAQSERFWFDETVNLLRKALLLCSGIIPLDLQQLLRHPLYQTYFKNYLTGVPQSAPIITSHSSDNSESNSRSHGETGFSEYFDGYNLLSLKFPDAFPPIHNGPHRTFQFSTSSFLLIRDLLGEGVSDFQFAFFVPESPAFHILLHFYRNLMSYIS